MRGAWWWVAIVGLVGCGSGPGGTGGTGPIVVSGRVLDLDGRPFPNVTVLVGSRPSVVTDAAGTFSVTDVSTPYDLTAIAPPNIRMATVYRGITRSDPMVVFGFVQSQRANAGYLAGAIVGGAPAATLDVTTWLAWASQEVVDAKPVDPAFSFLLRWNGQSTSSGKAHALQWMYDAEGLPSTYTGAAEASTALENGSATPPITLSLQPVTTASVSGSVSSPPAYPLTQIDLEEHFPDGASIHIGFDESPSSSFSYAIPDGIGATTTVIAASIEGTDATYAYTSARRSGVTATSGSLAMTLPSRAEPTSPAEGATGVTAATDFSWTPVASAIYILEVGCGATLRVYTRQTTARVPDLSARGLGFIPGGACSWRVYAQTFFADMDELAQNPRVGPDFSGLSTRSPFRNFTTQ